MSISQPDQPVPSTQKYKRFNYARALMLARKLSAQEAAASGPELSLDELELAAAKRVARMLRASH